MTNRSLKLFLPLALVLLVYLIICGLFAATLLPNCDEAWFLLPGYNLIEHGFFGTTVLDETATFRQVRLDGINHSTYWIMPLYSLTQAVWGKLDGFQLISQRFFSIFCGLITLSAWASIIKKLTGAAPLTLLAIILTAADYHFIYSSSLGRMDMMTVALGTSALAVFLYLREKNLDYAVLASFTLTALAFFTHPLGLVWLVSLAIFIALLDLKRIRFRHFAWAGIPYILFGFGWLLYIRQNPDLFLLQFGGNAADRWAVFRAPFSGFWLEVRDRYFYNFGIGEGLSRSGQIRIVVLAIYLAAIAAVAATKSLRRTTLGKFLLIIVLQEFIMLLLLDSMRQHLYMIYVTPTFSIILAVWINRLKHQGKFSKIIGFALVLFVVSVNLSVVFIRVRQDAYHSFYLEAADFLNRNAKPDDKIMASAEMWFALDKKENLTDDFRLGFRSGKRADFIVMDAVRYREWTDQLAKSDVANYQFVTAILSSDYQTVFENENYQIYQRK